MERTGKPRDISVGLALVRPMKSRRVICTGSENSAVHSQNDKGKGSLFDQSGWKCPGFNDVDTNNKKNKAAGRCIISDTDGDQAYSTWQREGDI